ncbi:immunoglobulin-like domain-containing protein [Bacillus sp. JCM 19034]|uniref:immunoglobulin-like domain-containing protein n=1 Tax=Bacillus sp. JCM 19034 TaxID=1481928 RepID=UPI000782C78E|nr:immunoglobulin-like domain-containing protein [Bacillus sp. JCM 19034]
MKTKWMYFQLVILFLLLASCSSLTLVKSEYGDLPSKLVEGAVQITMTVTKQTASSLEVEIVNSGELEIVSGEYYHIEKFQDDDWYVVPFQDDTVFTDIGYLLESEGVKELSIPLDQLAIDLDEGLYRVSKEFWYDGQGYIIAAPFEIVH